MIVPFAKILCIHRIQSHAVTVVIKSNITAKSARCLPVTTKKFPATDLTTSVSKLISEKRQQSVLDQVHRKPLM